jgi:hypothetical protein
MWKTPDRFWAQISPFTHILPSETAEIHCTAVDLALFRKPDVGEQGAAALLLTSHLSRAVDPFSQGWTGFSANS